MTAPPPPIDVDALFGPLGGYRRLGLAVSGGADSLALLLLAHRYATASGQPERFVVYSVDHGLRPEAGAEVAFVLRQAAALGFAARALRWDGAKPATGIQQAARLARYRLIGAAMAVDGVEALVTAHHLGDQAETVLMRLAHGSGIEGLRGMDPVSSVEGVTLIRPLLDIDPARLRGLVEAGGLVPVTDPGNSDPDYERVRWRQALPGLAALGLDARRLVRFAARMRDADLALEAVADEAFGRLATQAGPAISIERQPLAALPRAVAIRVLQRALREVGGSRKPHALAAVERLADRLAHGRPLRQTLHNCLVQAKAGEVRLVRESGRATMAAGREEPSAL